MELRPVTLKVLWKMEAFVDVDNDHECVHCGAM